jgi:hypothetical protein
MPLDQAADAAVEGAAFGAFPMMWIVVNALWIFNVTEVTGHFAVLRRAFSAVSENQRVQVVVIAFCFGALLEALAGFGTPVAICGVILVGLGFKPIKAAAVALVADTAPVARRDRDPDHHALPGHRSPGARPQSDGRSPDPVHRAPQPVRAGLHGGWPARVAGNMARRARCRRPILRRYSIALASDPALMSCARVTFVCWHAA